MNITRPSKISSKKRPGKNTATDAIRVAQIAWFMRAMSRRLFWEQIENWETVGSCSNGNCRVRQRCEPGASPPNEDIGYRSGGVYRIARHAGVDRARERYPRSGTSHHGTAIHQGPSCGIRTGRLERSRIVG